ncbi:unnamed protein product, partial [Heterosigma akashiwo]
AGGPIHGDPKPEVQFVDDHEDDMRPVLLPFSSTTDIDIEEHDTIFANYD